MASERSGGVSKVGIIIMMTMMRWPKQIIKKTGEKGRRKKKARKKKKRKNTQSNKFPPMTEASGEGR